MTYVAVNNAAAKLLIEIDAQSGMQQQHQVN
jgi:hypothetical protein